MDEKTQRHASTEEDLFEVVLVCTGNRCRSPIAKALLDRHALGMPVRVRSVGLLDLGPAPTLPEILELGSAHGLDLRRHRASYIGREQLSGADLVLGLERSHVAGAVVDGNAPYDKTFALREFVDLLQDVGPVPDEMDHAAVARKVVSQVHAARPRGFQAGQDVRDPFGGPKRGYEEMFRVVDGLVRQLVQGLFPHANISAAQTVAGK